MSYLVQVKASREQENKVLMCGVYIHLYTRVTFIILPSRLLDPSVIQYSVVKLLIRTSISLIHMY
jgi:predicted tellurium resistance membrane protein TerC